jgi:hypothetical protein
MMNRQTMLAIGRRLLSTIVVTIGLLAAGRVVYAQNAVWSRHYGGAYNEGGYACAPTADHGFMAVGSTYSYGNGDHDIYVVRLDSLGDTVWSRTFGGTATDFGRDVQVTPDSGCIVVGSTTSWGAGKEDLVILKVSSAGDLVWSKTYGGANSDEGWSVRWTHDSDLIVCGTTASSGAGYGDLWLLRLTRGGDSVWARTFGGAGGESGMAVRETNDGFIAVGATGTFGEGYSSIYAVKVNFAGDSIWAKPFGGAKADFGYAVEVSVFGDYLIAGSTASYGQGYYDAYLIDVTPFGDVAWEKTYGGAKDDRGYAICNIPSGDILLAGTTESSGQGGTDMYLLRLSPIGDVVWSTTYGGTQPDYCRGVTVDQKGNFIITGYSYSYAAGGSDLYVAELEGESPTDVHEIGSDDLPVQFTLAQNYPNPFNGTTHIQFSLPRQAEVSLTIFNLLGQTVRQWGPISQGAGAFQLDWDGTDDRGTALASGVYFYRLEAPHFSQSKKMILLK